MPNQLSCMLTKLPGSALSKEECAVINISDPDGPPRLVRALDRTACRDIEFDRLTRPNLTDFLPNFRSRLCVEPRYVAYASSGLLCSLATANRSPQRSSCPRTSTAITRRLKTDASPYTRFSLATRRSITCFPNSRPAGPGTTNRPNLSSFLDRLFSPGHLLCGFLTWRPGIWHAIPHIHLAAQA